MPPIRFLDRDAEQTPGSSFILEDIYHSEQFLERADEHGFRYRLIQIGANVGDEREPVAEFLQDSPVGRLFAITLVFMARLIVNAAKHVREHRRVFGVDLDKIVRIGHIADPLIAQTEVRAIIDLLRRESQLKRVLTVAFTALDALEVNRALDRSETIDELRQPEQIMRDFLGTWGTERPLDYATHTGPPLLWQYPATFPLPSQYPLFCQGYTDQTMQNYEVEVKSLLGSRERADEIRAKLKEIDPACECLSRNKQLNHYFTGGDIGNLAEIARDQLMPEAAERLDDLASRAMEYSVRTRDKDGQILLVVKASVGADSSSNGVARIEFEENVQLTLEELDKLVLSAGFTFQAKWSREREEYQVEGLNITLDKNAGYGWIAEFEKVVDDPAKLDAAKADIVAFMQKIGAEELPQERLERMFTYYNTHWQDYYGTDKIFTIE